MFKFLHGNYLHYEIMVLALFVFSCTSAPSHGPVGHANSASCDDSTGADNTVISLPILASRNLVASDKIPDANSWDSETFDNMFPELAKQLNMLGDAQTRKRVIFARAIIHAKYGSIMAPSNLEWIERSFPNSETVRFRQSYRGYLLSRIVLTVEFNTGVFERVLGVPRDIQAIRNSEQPIISAAAAVAAWREFARRHGKTLEDIAAIEKCKLTQPYLLFREFLPDRVNEINGIQFRRIYNPTWVLDDREKICVNAHSGKAWFDFEK